MAELIFLTQDCPFPPIGGGRLRDSGLIQALAQIVSVEVIYLSGSTGLSANSSHLDRVSLTEITRESSSKLKKSLYLIRPYVMNGYSTRVEFALKERRKSAKILWLSRLTMAKYLKVGQELGYQVILDEHNIESDLLLSARTRSLSDWYQWMLAIQCKRFETRTCQTANQVIVTSLSDLERLKILAPDIRPMVLPNAIDVAGYSHIAPPPSDGFALFAGVLDYQPNVEGLGWFVKEVIPKLNFKAAAICAAGARPQKEFIERLNSYGIRVMANPPSMAEVYAQSQFVIVPLLSGGGTRLKILEAMAARRPVISTSKGAEGLGAESGTHLIIADNPSDFAQAMQKLTNEPRFGSQMAESAYTWVMENYDWRKLIPKMKPMISSMIEKGLQ